MKSIEYVELNLLRDKEKAYNKLKEYKTKYEETHDEKYLVKIEECEGSIYGIDLQLEGLRYHSKNKFFLK